MASIYDDRVMGKLKQIGYNALVFGTHFDSTPTNSRSCCCLAQAGLFFHVPRPLARSFHRVQTKVRLFNSVFFSLFLHFCDIADMTIIYKKI